MFNVRLAGVCEMAVHLAVLDGVSFCAVFFSHEMSWMKSGTELSRFLRIFPIYFYRVVDFFNVSDR